MKVRPALITWAIERSRIPRSQLERRFPKIPRWIRGKDDPTLRQLEDFALATHTPIGYFFLQKPPDETIPIPDFRTFGSAPIGRPSPNLLETLYTCQQRQEWYRDFARATGQSPLDFIGSVRITASVESAALKMRTALGIDVDERKEAPTWSDALRLFVDRADQAGILVMVNGVVGTNNRRTLDPEEFRGFALVDEYAPLIFINGADSKSAQMFSLAHEIAHLWLGKEGLSNPDAAIVPGDKTERWCNRVAAELLVPIEVFKRSYSSEGSVEDQMKSLSRQFKVSTLVILRRMRDSGGLTAAEFSAAYDEELKRLQPLRKAGGGDFYRTQVIRLGRRFAGAVVSSSSDGQTTYKDAFRLLGISKPETLRRLGQSVGVL